MKETLLKKRYGIPVALLLVLLFSGVALAAWFWFATIESTTKVVAAPVSATTTNDFSTEMYPSQSNTWTFDIVNSGSKPYSVTADLIYSAPNGVSVTEFMVRDNNKTDDLKDDNSATFNIVAGENLPCSFTITAARDATLGDVSATFDLSATFVSPE